MATLMAVVCSDTIMMPETTFDGVQDMGTADRQSRLGTDATNGLWISLAVCCLLYVIVAGIFLSARGFWSPDSAVRFVQVESFVRYGSHGLAVPYPAGSVDPQGRYFPFGPWFHFVRDGRYYVSYPPYFPALVAPLYRAFGYGGLIVLPLLAGLGTVWVTHNVLRRHVPEFAVAGAITLGLATPLVIYSTVFWDHAPVVFLASAALGLVARACAAEHEYRYWDLVFAGVLLGLGLWFRNELYVLVPAVLVAWLCLGPRGRPRGALALVAGLVVPCGVLWALNRHLSGSLLGWKGEGLAASRASGLIETATGHSAGAWLVDKLGNLYYQLISPDYYAFNLSAVIIGLLLAAGFVLAVLLLRLGVSRLHERAIVAAGLLSAAIGILILLRRTDVSGLLSAAPFLVLALLPGSRARWERFLWGVALLFIAGIIVTGTHGGLQWGPRYLLPILPALVWLAAAAMARVRATTSVMWPSLRLTAGMLVVISLLIQASGVDQVSQMMTTNARVNGALRAAPADIVVTPLQWVTLESGPVYFEKSLMLVAQPDDFRALVTRFTDVRVARWTYIPLSGSFFSPAALETWAASHSYQFRAVDDQTRGGLRLVTFAGVSAPIPAGR